mmetsp:Transcript_14483/g.50912  ORF Transcript_14483/g.50912 Transcript_14483/m.50912 type:complete len:341 (+) Transcript_14483:10292-11314(+)
MVHQLDLQRREIRFDEVDDDLGVLFVDLPLHFLVPVDVLAHDGQGALGLLVPTDEGILVLRHNRLVGRVPELELFLQLRGAVVETTQHFLHVLDAALFVFGDFLKEALLLLGWLRREHNRVGCREVARLFQLLLQDAVALRLFLQEMLPDARHHRERHRHVAADLLQQVFELTRRGIEIHLDIVEHGLDTEEWRRLCLVVAIQGLAQLLQARLDGFFQCILDPLVHLLDIQLPLFLDVAGMRLEELVGVEQELGDLVQCLFEHSLDLLAALFLHVSELNVTVDGLPLNLDEVHVGDLPADLHNIGVVLFELLHPVVDLCAFSAAVSDEELLDTRRGPVVP